MNHEHTDECCTIADDGGEVLDCQHTHDSECGYVQTDPGQPCGYECPLCPIEALIAALPRALPEDNRAEVETQLQEILDLYRELSEDEQEQIGMTLCWDLLAALDPANVPVTADGHAERQESDEASVDIGGSITYYSTLEEAFSAANGNTATITMLTDAECTSNDYNNPSPLAISSGTVTLDMNGKTLSGSGYGLEGAIIGVSGGSLTVQGGGIVEVQYVGIICTDGILTVADTTFNLVGPGYGSADCAIQNGIQSARKGGTVNINGGTITGNASNGQIFHYLGNTTISNVTATGTTDSDVYSVKYDNNGTLKINGGTFDSIALSDEATGISDVAGLLGDNVIYKHQGGTWATDNEMAGRSIENVTVEKIPLTINPQAETSWYYNSGAHSLQMNVAPATEGGTITYEWYAGSTKLDCIADAYPVPITTAVGNYTYTCKATCDGYTLSHEFTFTVAECPHTGLVYEPQEDGKHGGTCPTCGTVVSEEHTWADGVCSVCNLKAVAKVEIGNDTTYYGTLQAAVDAAASGTVTLLADVEMESCVKINSACTLTLDLNGHNISCTDNDADAIYSDKEVSVTIKGDGEVQGANYAVSIYGGSLILEGGVFRGEVNVQGSLSASTPGALTVTGAGVNVDSLLIGTRATVALSAGTYEKIEVVSGYLKDLLTNYGAQTTPHYAYFNAQGNPIALEENQRELTGTVTVKECKHEGVKATPNNDDTHSLKCPYCGYSEAATACTYGTEYQHDDTNHWQTCTVCRYENKEAHNWGFDSAQSGNVIENYWLCFNCRRTKDHLTLTITVPDGLTYGNTEGKQVTCTVSPETTCDKVTWSFTGGSWTEFADGILPAGLSVGEHQFRVVGLMEDDTLVFSGSYYLTVSAAPLTEDMVTLPENVTYSGTAQKPALTVKQGDVTLKEGTDYDVTYSTTDFINAGKITITITGKGNYEGTVTKDYTIGKAQLTIKANDQTITYGQNITLGVGQVTVGALCGSDRLESVTLTASSDQVLVEGKTITPSAANIKNGSGQDVTGNYQITYEKGNLTITPVEVNLIFEDQTITYGETPTAATADLASAKIEYSYTTSADGESIPGWPTNAGTYTVTAKVEASGNYGAASETATLTINKAKATPVPGTLEVQNNRKQDYTYTLSQLLPALDSGKTLGTVTYTLGTVTFTATGYYDSTNRATIADGKLTLPIEAVETNALADIGTIMVTITSQNYTDMTATITVKSVNKTTVDISGVSVVGRTYNGTAIAATGTPVATVDGQTVSVRGFVYTWDTPDGKAPVNAGSYTLTVSVDPEDQTYTGSTTISVVIGQAEIKITAPSQTIYVGGTAPTFSASDCTIEGLVSGDSLKTQPTVAYTETPDTSKTGTVTIKASGAVVPDGGNYKDTIIYVDGLLSITTRPVVSVSGVSLSPNSLTLTIGESFSLTITITPNDADNKSVTWASGNSAIASVSGGTVTAVGVGTTTITVTTQSGNHTATCTVTVKAKQYTVAYDANGGTGNMSTSTVTDGEAFRLPGCSFTPPTGKVFDCWAIGSIDGTQVKAGDSHTFNANTTIYALWKDAPLVTYTITYNANGGTGTMNPGTAPDQEAFVLPECGFAAPDGKVFDAWAIGGTTGTKVQAGGSYTFTANTTVYALWKDLPPVPHDITGIVRQDGGVVPGATVQLKQGATVIAQQTTGADGSFTFNGVLPGVYNLVAEKDGITVTVMREIINSSANLTITLPTGKTNTVVEIKDQEETPPVVVGKMDTLFTDDKIYTTEDKQVVSNGGTVEFKLVVEKQDTSSSAAVQIEATKPTGQTIGLFLDLSIIKTVTQQGSEAQETEVKEINTLIETLIPLPAEMQGKASYTVYREHDGKVEALPSSGTGERYEVGKDKTTITIFAQKYSTYAIAWSDSSTTTPVDPGTVTPSRPTGGGGGSSVSTYAVTVSKTTHGKVTSNRTNASSGSTVTLIVTPDSGYELDTLTVTDSRGSEIKLTAQSGGKYTFSMPSRAVTVAATFKLIQTGWINPYSDVAAGAWYYDAVQFASENGLMNGYTSTLFGPNDSLSRAQLAQILYNRAGRPTVRTGSTFTDVAPGAWYANAVTWAAAEGIVSGYGGGLFGPNDPITREQLAVMLWRYAGTPTPPNLLLTYQDINTTSGYALDALRWAVEQGIISGYGSNLLGPKDTSTRAQVAQMLKNFIGTR